MTRLHEIYKCKSCGNIVEVLHEGAGTLVCCGQEMEILTEKTNDAGQEKHVPVIEKTKAGIKVKCGSIPHPMVDEHYIEWIQIIVGSKSYNKLLKPGDAPEAEFEVKPEGVIARAYCNVHGLWKSK